MPPDPKQWQHPRLNKEVRGHHRMEGQAPRCSPPILSKDIMCMQPDGFETPPSHHSCPASMQRASPLRSSRCRPERPPSAAGATVPPPPHAAIPISQVQRQLQAGILSNAWPVSHSSMRHEAARKTLVWSYPAPQPQAVLKRTPDLHGNLHSKLMALHGHAWIPRNPVQEPNDAFNISSHASAHHSPQKPADSASPLQLFRLNCCRQQESAVAHFRRTAFIDSLQHHFRLPKSKLFCPVSAHR